MAILGTARCRLLAINAKLMRQVPPRVIYETRRNCNARAPFTPHMRIYAQALVIGLLAAAAACNALRAEQAPSSSSLPCPQDYSKGPAPPRGTSPTDNPSDRLADSKGVVCPPTRVDPGIRAKPPTNEGTIKVVPAPGTPGSDSKAQPGLR